MASERALAERRAAVLDRIAAAADVLADRFDLDVPAALLRPPTRDPDVGRVLQLEAFADVLDGVLQATEKDDGRATKQTNKTGSAIEGKQAKTNAGKA